MGWKLSFHHRSSSSTSSDSSSPTTPPPPPPPPPLPMELTCPISGSLMADPVILPSGQSFDRACIQACLDLHLVPPSVPLDLSFIPILIPNLALKSAISSFCSSHSLPLPVPLTPSAARLLLRRLSSTSSDLSQPFSSDEEPNSAIQQDAHQISPQSRSSETRITPPPEIGEMANQIQKIEAVSARRRRSMETLTVAPPPPPDPLEDEILARIKTPNPQEQEAALLSLRQATRESGDRRIALCTPRLLAGLRPLLLSRHPSLQAHAAASLVNLSLESPNKVTIVRSGAVPPLVDALRYGHPEARDHAAGALFSLALDDENKAAIGVLGAVPPLLRLFSQPQGAPRPARRDAGMALYHLSLAGTSRTKIARSPGAVRGLLAVAAEEWVEGEVNPSLVRLALMMVCSLAGFSEGRAALMDAGAVAGLIGLIRNNVALPATEVEYIVAALHGMSRGSLRFRGLAREAGAEEVLARIADGGSGEIARETVRRTLMVLRGEEEEEEFVSEDGGSVASDGLVSFRRRYKDFGNVSGANSAEF